ncbi:hypothetical protein NGRA_0734 [Nosema granulosis]|uniref:Uncharacterized protein n=1 Tax=Nosema granulosis TaxID=83296 RepID=A0A9P6H2I0_9MICR|nr:hypothetical protein NGRA_0734 [Nosema granulosis]
MISHSLSKFLDGTTIAQNTICISEILPQNVDFLIRDMTDMLGSTSLFTFNESADHFKSILDNKVQVHSIYDRKYHQEAILDDVYIARNIFNVEPASKIVVFRSNTCKKIDYYDYDLVIKVEPLKSGCCRKFDGMISIINRTGTLKCFKYKIGKDRTHYYDL